MHTETELTETFYVAFCDAIALISVTQSVASQTRCFNIQYFMILQGTAVQGALILNDLD